MKYKTLRIVTGIHFCTTYGPDNSMRSQHIMPRVWDRDHDQWPGPFV